MPKDFSDPIFFLTNMDYLFWRTPKELDLSYFLWILWYIWKNRNGKIYKNQIKDPLDLLRTAEIESVLWAESQTKYLINRAPPHIVENHDALAIDKCYIDGVRREHDSCTGQGWVYKKGGSTDT